MTNLDKGGLIIVTNIYTKVRNISDKDISLVTVKDHVKNTLNLTVATQNRVIEMRFNLHKILVSNKIDLHKKTWEVIYTDLMKATLKVSKLQTTISKIKIQLKQEKVENKIHQQQIKKLQGGLLVIDNEVDKG